MHCKVGIFICSALGDPVIIILNLKLPKCLWGLLKICIEE